MEDNKRLKILILPRWYPNDINQVECPQIRENAKAISLYNDVVVLYNDRRSQRKVKGLRMYEVLSDKIEDGIRTTRIRHRKASIRRISQYIYLHSVQSVYKGFLKQGWRPDIIHIQVFSGGRPAIIIGKRYKIPVVVTERWSALPRRALEKKDEAQARFIMNNADIILPVCEALKTAIKSYGIQNNFKVIPNAVNTKIFHPSYDKKDKKKKNILFVARITEIKGIPFLLQALVNLAEKRRDFFLDVVGEGPRRAEYEQLTEQLGLSDLVKFHGSKKTEEVACFMRKSDFFVLPSIWENNPNVLLEAMASGLPIIASDVGGIPEVIRENIGVLFPPKNSDALAKIINYMLDHHQDYSAEKISQYAHDNFSFEVVGKKLDDIYRKILKKNIITESLR